MTDTRGDRQPGPRLAEAGFLWTTCQVGAENAVKREISRDWPDFRFAYSRPGFLTFKLPEPHYLLDDFSAQLVFARAQGFSRGRAVGETLAARASQALEVAGELDYDRLHVWPRDPVTPGHHGFEPGQTEESAAARAALLQAAAQRGESWAARLAREEPAVAGELVLDVMLIEADSWWVGFHRVGDWSSQRPGGLFEMPLPPEAVSRAYLKMREALDWSGMPYVRGDHAVEIGSAPGGAAQALLDRGLYVMGIDPAEMHSDVLAHPNFTHVRKRGSDVRRREFRKTRWLFADLNVAPSYTLDTVEAIVTHSDVNLRGLLLTLKLLDWKLAADVPEYLARIGQWGFRDIRARQLSHHRQEFCVTAQRAGRRGGGPG